MSTGHPLLEPEDLRVLDSLGKAVDRSPNQALFEYKPLDGWPFAWLIHPELEDGVQVLESVSLFRLLSARMIELLSGNMRSQQAYIRLTQTGIDLIFQRRMARDIPEHKITSMHIRAAK